MADDNKKPGARDISDLKARLGLKKTGTMATVTPDAGAPAPAPGMPAAAAPIPSPFGQPAPAPAAPAAPADPRRDPFSAAQQQQAANLAAFYGYGQQLPGTAEAGAGTPMEKKKPWALIGVVVGGMLLVFIVGSSWGGISKSRVEFNETTDHAVVIRNEVEKLQKQLDTIIAEFRGQAGAKPVEQAQRLGDLKLETKKPNTNVIFHTNYAQLEGLGMERLFSYYNMTIKLYDDIALHAKKTAADKDALLKAAENAQRTEKNYGIVVDPSGPVPIATFVEMGNPVCPVAGATDCKPDEMKFKYRVDANAQWSERPLKGDFSKTVTPIKRNNLFNAVASGSVDVTDAYKRRVQAILEEIAEIEKINKELMADLKKTASRPKVFTF